MSRSYTSRPARIGERDGIDYHFVTRERFQDMLAADAFLEWADVFGNFYGTSAADTERLLADGQDVVLVIDVQGARQVKATGIDHTAIFVLPPSFEILVRRPPTPNNDTEEQMQRRLATARAEAVSFTDYDYVVVNDQLEPTVVRLQEIIAAERSRTHRMRGIADRSSSRSAPESPMTKSLIALGVTGGIGAYKAVEIARGLQKQGHEVVAVMTESAQRFVTPLTFEAITRREVITELWTPGTNADIEHIALASEIDLLLVAPCTANTIGRFAHGLADDFLTSMYLATTAPVVLAPAMNSNMHAHPAVVENLARLEARRADRRARRRLLACGWIGRAASPSPRTSSPTSSRCWRRHHATSRGGACW